MQLPSILISSVLSLIANCFPPALNAIEKCIIKCLLMIQDLARSITTFDHRKRIRRKQIEVKLKQKKRTTYYTLQSACATSKHIGYQYNTIFTQKNQKKKISKIANKKRYIKRKKNGTQRMFVLNQMAISFSFVLFLKTLSLVIGCIISVSVIGTISWRRPRILFKRRKEKEMNKILF